MVNVVWILGQSKLSSIKMVVIIHPWVIQTETGPIINYIWKVMINLVLLVMVDVVLVLWPPTSPPRKLVLVETGMMRSLSNLSTILQNPQWNNHVLGKIQLILMVIINLVLHLVMAQVVWILGSTNIPPINIIFGLMGVIFCHLRVDIIHLWLIQANKGPILHHIGGGRINVSELFQTTL